MGARGREYRSKSQLIEFVRSTWSAKRGLFSPLLSFNRLLSVKPGDFDRASFLNVGIAPASHEPLPHLNPPQRAR
jgi:hypothetical protein